MTGLPRRAFLETLAGASVAAPLFRRLPPLGQSPAARPTPAQLRWQDLEVGMFVHLAPNTWQDRESDDRSTPLSRITPEIDTDQWAEVAVSMGARYVVLVAKHAGGFCLWQTRTTDYGIRNTPWKRGRGDVMADLARSCAARGLGLGVYLSPRDDSLGAGQSGRAADPSAQERINRIVRTQLEELLTRYGPMVEVWFDGSTIVPVGDLLRRHAPDAMVFQGPHATIRWVGNEDGFAPYPAWNAVAAADARTGIATAIHGDPAGEVWLPLEVDVSIRRPDWFWHTDNEAKLLSLPDLLDIYYRSVGRGCQLLLNLPPDRTGRIPAADAARAAELGGEVRRRFGTAVAAVSGEGRELELTLPARSRIDHFVIEEDLAEGERVRDWRIEWGYGGGAEWVPLARGTAIGHKRIQPIIATEVELIRLVIADAVGIPRIRRFAAHATGSYPPERWNAPAPVWADDEAGGWTGGSFDLDLTPRIPAPGSYRLRFVGRGPVTVMATLAIGGVPADLLRAVPGRPDLLHLTITAVGAPIRLRGAVSGPARGTVLVRRL